MPINLPELFDKAEAKKSWSVVLAKLEELSTSENTLQLPDWVFVEIIWLKVQFEKKLSTAKSLSQKKLFKKHLLALKALSCWSSLSEFDQKFPLLDRVHLQYRGIALETTSLSQFLVQAKSKDISPHPLLDYAHYKSISSVNKDVHHPFVHFFRYSSGYQEKALTPNPYFDCDWYRNTYLSDGAHQHPLLHYVAHFHENKIQPSLHFYNAYVRETQQLPVDADPLSHYLKERRNIGLDFCFHGFSPCPYFDRSFYLERYPDIKTSIENIKIDPFSHFIHLGVKEGRAGHRWLRSDMFAPARLPGFLDKKRRVVFILGMHRSGTSAITRLINLLGMDLPDNLMEANTANETGYWESGELANRYHEQILGAFGSAWDDVFPIADYYWQSEEAGRYKFALAHYIVREFDNSDGFVLKDPRMCKLVPVWLGVFASLNVQIKVVIPFRNPLEVAGSLHAREGFLKEKSFLLWLRHIVDTEFYTRGLERCFVSYEDLLTDHQKVIDQIASQCDIEWPNNSAATQQDISQFINAKYYHQRVDDAQLNDEVPDWVLRVYAALKQLSHLSVDEPACRVVLDGVTREMAQAESLYGNIIVEKKEDLQNLFTLTQQKHRQIVRLIEQADDVQLIVRKNALK